MSNTAWTGLFTFLSITVVIFGYLVLNFLSFRREQRRRVIETLVDKYVDNGIEKALIELQRLSNLYVILTVGSVWLRLEDYVTEDKVIEQLSEFIVGERIDGLMSLPEIYSFALSGAIHALLDCTHLHKAWDTFDEKQKKYLDRLSRKVRDNVSLILDQLNNTLPRIRDIIWKCKTFEDFQRAVAKDKKLLRFNEVMLDSTEFLDRVGRITSGFEAGEFADF